MVGNEDEPIEEPAVVESTIATAGILAKVVVDTAASLKASNEAIAGKVKSVADENAAALAAVVKDTATELRISNATIAAAVKDLAKQNATILAELTTETAAGVKSTAEENARVLKETTDRNAELGPLLLASLSTVGTAVDELADTANELSTRSESETDLLKGTSKYFIAIIVLLLVVVGLEVYSIFFQ